MFFFQQGDTGSKVRYITYCGNDAAEISGHHQWLNKGEITHAEQEASWVRQDPVHIASHRHPRQSEPHERGSSTATLRLTTLCPGRRAAPGRAVRTGQQSLIRLRNLALVERRKALRFQTLSWFLAQAGVRERFDGCEPPSPRFPAGTGCHPDGQRKIRCLF